MWLAVSAGQWGWADAGAGGLPLADGPRGAPDHVAATLQGPRRGGATVSTHTCAGWTRWSLSERGRGGRRLGSVEGGSRLTMVKGFQGEEVDVRLKQRLCVLVSLCQGLHPHAAVGGAVGPDGQAPRRGAVYREWVCALRLHPDRAGHLRRQGQVSPFNHLARAFNVWRKRAG